MTDDFLKRLHSVAYRVTKAECLDLPAITEEVRTVDLEKDAIKLYDSIEDESYAELDESEVTTANILTRLLRLSQITGGHLTDDDGVVNTVSRAKLDALSDIIDSAMAEDKKLVIMARFVPELDDIQELLEKKKIGYAVVRGGVKDRDNEIHRFQYCNDSVCLIFGQKATLWIFALLISSMHYTWVKRLSGRLMSNIRYSNSLYEHFPLPRLKETDKQQLSALAKKILQIRAEHYENGTTLAALYDRLPLDLKSAHMQLDNFVEKLYGGVFIDDNERMERLIDVYETRQISGDREYLSDKLKQLRLNKGLTLWALSVKTGIEADLLACYEKRSIVVAKGAIDILAKFYGIDKSELEAYPNNKSGQ